MITRLLPRLAAYAVTGRGRTNLTPRRAMSRPSTNLAFLGRPGAGKTVPIKNLAAEQIDRGRAIVLDPRHNYTPIDLMLGGRSLKLDRAGRTIDPLEGQR